MWEKIKYKGLRILLNKLSEKERKEGRRKGRKNNRKERSESFSAVKDNEWSGNWHHSFVAKLSICVKGLNNVYALWPSNYTSDHSFQGWIVNISGYVTYAVAVTSTQICYCRAKVARAGNRMGLGTIPVKLFTKTGGS